MNAVNFPENLLVSPTPGLGRGANDWVTRHNMTVSDYIKSRVGATNGLRSNERAILSLADGIASYISHGPEHPDGVATREVGALLDAFGALLDFDLGRLDGGALSAWAHATANRIGWNLDVSDFA